MFFVTNDCLANSKCIAYAIKFRNILKKVKVRIFKSQIMDSVPKYT